MCWIIFNSIMRLILTGMMALGIVWFEHWLSKLEKVGMGFIGGASFLTIPVIVAAGHDATPFDGWASSVLTLGVIIFFCGWMQRKRLHDLANSAQRRVAEEWFSSRGR